MIIFFVGKVSKIYFIKKIDFFVKQNRFNHSKMPKRFLTEEQKQRRKERDKINYEKNKEIIKEKSKEYRKNNKEKINAYKRKESKTTGAITLKIRTCRNEDKQKNREFNIDKDYIKVLIEETKNICKYCKENIKFEWEEANDRKQFTINRLNNNIGHIKGNVEICCMDCNIRLANMTTQNLEIIYMFPSLFQRN